MPTKKTPKKKPANAENEGKEILEIFNRIQKTEKELQLELVQLKKHLEMNRFYRSL
ncbi:MAG: hypothetical protein M3480_05250 [Verrucomicrobiota bacterium]|nr:hypothetical protein [Chthoniobacterales bacterium]MDQ3414368.1 hypothetical protein [Verrucomicrobiota bacterium]